MKILALEFSSTRRSVAVAQWDHSGFHLLNSVDEDATRASTGLALIERGLSASPIAATEPTFPQSRVEEEQVERGSRRALNLGPRTSSTPAFPVNSLTNAVPGQSPKEINVIAVGLGPGSYAGIRSAIALAQGWQLGRGVSLLGISSMEVLAHEAQAQGITGEITLVVDAQRREVYEAQYSVTEERIERRSDLRISLPSEISSRTLIAGPGASSLIVGARDLYPSASTLARLASSRNNYVPGEHLEPIYLREVSFVKAPPSRLVATKEF